MTSIAPYGKYYGVDGNGNPLSGGQLFTYEAGTTTPKATYTTAAGDVANTNPVVLNASGLADVWLGDGGYKFVLKDSLGNTIFTVDDIGGSSSTAFGGEVNVLSTNTNITSVYANSVNICTGTITLSLLAAGAAEEGFYFSVKNQGSGIVTIDPDAGELIDGQATLAIGPGLSAFIICDGATWYSLFFATVSASGTNTWTGVNTFQNVVNTAKGADVASAATTNIWSVTGNQIDITGTATITSFGTAPQAGCIRIIETDAVCTITNNANIITDKGSNIVCAAGRAFLVYADSTTVARVYSIGEIPPTKQYLRIGTTYNTPVGARLLDIQEVGGGGGGGARDTNSGQAGTATSFNSIAANPGGGGTFGASSTTTIGGAGGTGGAGAADLRVPGNGGMVTGGSHSPGGASFFGGAPATSNASGNPNVGTNGSGGAGAASNSLTLYSGGSGGAGEYVEFSIANPAATYTYAIGQGGAGGTAGTVAGAAGGNGLIVVTEYY